MKKFLRLMSLLAPLALVMGCSTPSSRIAKHQAAFDGWPADVRQKVQSGHVDVGFTAEMVQVALGEADRAYTRTTAQGTSDVWVYLDHGPKFAVGVGVGSYSGNTAISTGVTLGDDVFRENEILRVVFQNGRVVAVETRKR